MPSGNAFYRDQVAKGQKHTEHMAAAFILLFYVLKVRARTKQINK
jgi:hypothetical protein